MCGVAGRFHPAALPAAPDWHRRADEALRHRGPDDGGHFHDSHCELVHRRLAIIDLSPTGHQPMTNEDGTIYVVFNGEIYNHRELRYRLEALGHVFRGTADTEVLVHLYEDCGERLVEHLRGIFAFAVYDRPRRRLTLARDRFGVKPLFYTHDAGVGQWIFASEMKAITAWPGFQPQLDRQACYDYLGLGYIPEPATGFANIQALPPATTLTVTPGGPRCRRYHATDARPDGTRDLHDTVDALTDTLTDAVRRQAKADVPVAALLSGGIDSSLVVAAQCRAATAPAATFNVRFPDPRHDETAMARTVANAYQTSHHTIDIDEHRLTADAIVDLFRHFDQPFADTSCIPMYWVARAVRDRGLVCALSGDGGDEAFGGYARFWRINRLVRLMGTPGWLRRAARIGGRSLARGPAIGGVSSPRERPWPTPGAAMVPCSSPDWPTT